MTGSFKYLHFLSDSPFLRPLAYRMLSADRLSRNPLYRHIYSRRIKGMQERRLAYPKTVAIEGTNACNSACIMCGHKGMTRAQGVMPMELYARILEQLKDWRLESLLLSGFGEPLLDPRLEERIALAKARGFGNIGLVSNASLLYPEKAAKLISAGLDLMHISLDGATPETFHKLRPGLDHRTVIQNIDHILSLSPRPRIFIQVVTLDANAEETTTLQKIWGPKADRLIFRQAQDWAGQVPLPDRQDSPHLMARKLWPPCLYLWDQMNIYWDGTVPSCCLDYEARQPLGNAAGQALVDIWQGPVLKDLRQKHNAGQRDQLSLCRQCRYFSVWW